MVAFLTLAGCSALKPRPTIIPPIAAQSEPVHTIDKNYQIGQPMKAFVGSPMIRVKDYYVTHRDTGTYLLPKTVTFHQLFFRAKTFAAGTPVILIGYYMLDGQRLKMLVLPDRDASIFALLVDESGHFTNKLFNRVQGKWFEQTGGKIASVTGFDPPLNFATHTVDEVSTEGGYTNFELVYSGASANQLNLIYREYTPTDLARAAFTQSLTYDRNSPTVRFRNIRITVLSADNEGIRYIVDDDGLDDKNTHK
ncbi:hypothetical protein ACVCL3_15845 [Rhodanobacter sp. UC4437_H4]